MSPYCPDYFNRIRYKTRSVAVGNINIGGNNPIRVQSMTTTDTMDTEGSVQQSIRMIEAGCEIVRLTAPSKREAENLRIIKDKLTRQGYSTPLVADIHFTPNAAEIAADYVEKIRVNPGNYADKKRFEEIVYTDASYLLELERIEERFTPLVLKCKKNKVAMRIGTNHGSLSDRILSRYGDTPEGMVESAMEFVRICAKHDYHDLVLSMKASNTLVMVQAYRLLVAVMVESDMNYPLHLGVTEAGDGEDGRIKSAVGIGALLEDGLGDTIRVSLTEDPEFEVPVAQKLLEKYVESKREDYYFENSPQHLPHDPFSYERRKSRAIENIGGSNVPVVFGDLSAHGALKPAHLFALGYNYSMPLDKWNFGDATVDYVYIGSQLLPFERPGALGIVCDLPVWKQHYSKKKGFYPIGTASELNDLSSDTACFVRYTADITDLSFLQKHPSAIIVLSTEFSNKTQVYRHFFLNLAKLNLLNPVVLCSEYHDPDPERYQLWTSADIGSMFIDGFGDGIWLKGSATSQLKNSTSFGILQATRTRISKTEYISCPSCGRTLFDLQETTAKIRAHTSHLKGLKIGIMGCVVNGPGEMADADYGYVGTGPGKIHLYKAKVVMRKNVDEENAVSELIDLIKEHGDWIDPK
ncbi:MAG: 4-hydroxy-3-methylbut-2-en-1-yl diphosphate synthase [Bacteroidetes bacterium RIFCSPHIGHO2_02_FULL_44_7]|nr:MAG: 4-hydroxy-3-methylbut-2-en-1-yl diphosphate synthase [Bacteroidetes bacterium RIFCSPHIGHO2_02_FULL_44_7]